MTTNLSSLSLFIATPNQVKESRCRTSLEWGKGMTQAQYLERDAYTDTHENARDNRLITWVLAPRDEPTSLEFFCSCETFRRDGLVWYPFSPQNCGGARPPPQEVTCYAIASVFTPPTKRGKGYARHMMRLLHWVIADTPLLPEKFPEEWGAPPARVKHAGRGQFSALWSDVGKDFYQQCGPLPEQEGWIVINALSTVWDVPNGMLNLERESWDSQQWAWLDESQVVKLWEKDANNIANSSELPDDDQFSLAFLPHNGVAAFQHRRNKFFLDQLVPKIEYWGVISLKSNAIESALLTQSDATFATWTMEIRPPGPKTLLITRLRSRSEDFKDLLTLIITMAQTYGMTKVEIYNLPNVLQPVALSLGGTTFERAEHLSALKWYGSEDTRKVNWLFNERFCWC